MNNDQKMLPSTLSKSTEITNTHQKSTELAKRQFSGEIARANSNITSAKSNVNRANNGRGSGYDYGSRGNGGDGTTVEIFLSNPSYNSESGYSSAQSYSQSQYSSSESFCFQQPDMNNQNYSSIRAYSPQQQSQPTTGIYGAETLNVISNTHGSDANHNGQHFRKSPETYREHDTKKQKVYLFSSSMVILAILALQLLLVMVNAISHLAAQVCSNPFMLIVFLTTGFFLFKKHGTIRALFLSKPGLNITKVGANVIQAPVNKASTSHRVQRAINGQVALQQEECK